MPDLKNGRWTEMKEMQQWQFGFEVTPTDFKNPNMTVCIDRITNKLSAKRSDIFVGYTAPQG